MSSSVEPTSAKLQKDASSSPAADSKAAPARSQQLGRKRSSIQSNMSSLAATSGSGRGSLHSSSSTATSAEDLEERAAEPKTLDFEHVRNTTILFFLDRLYLASQEGKGARTLHELSCWFGSKEFTKDMRRIVASRNGLKKFLQSYPSLFQIEDDKVFLTQLKRDTGVKKRDYNLEAVEYFKLKLLQFGTSLVPIKNLFGYRSQASQEVRHVSGKNTHDFKLFLRRNEHVFEILADEHVVLKSALAELESRGQSSLVLEQSLQPAQADEAIVSDPYLNKQFSHLIESCIRSMRDQEVAASRLAASKQDEFSVSLEVLHEQIQKQCQNELFLNMVKSLESLKMFLRMHPKLFKRFKCEQGRDCVALLSEQERKELELTSKAHRQSILQRQHSTLGLKAEPARPLGEQQAQQLAASSAPSPGPERDLSSLPPMSQTSSTTTTTTKAATTATATTNHQRELNKSPSGATSRRQLANQSKVGAPSAGQQLRAAAPPFVPSCKPQSSQEAPSRPIASQKQKQQQQQHKSENGLKMQRSHSNLGSARSAQNPAGAEQRRAPLQASLSSGGPALVDQRQAIRSYLTQNKPTSYHNMNWAPTRRQQPGEPAPLKPQQAAAAAAAVASTIPAASESELRARTVDMVREASNIITRIMSSAEAVAFDCKGYNLGFDGQITLIQFGYLPTKKVDPMRSLERADQQPAAAAAESDSEPAGRRVKPEVCVFDLITNPELAYCLKPLLESDSIVKIVHDVRNKSNALFVQFKIILNNVFDTQVANLVIQQQDTGKPAYKSRYISMSKLCEIYGDDELMKYRNIIKHKTRHAASSKTADVASPSSNSNSNSNSGSSSSSSSSRNSKDVNYWRARPLTKPMIFEATMDVYCLVGGIYQNLRNRIKPEYEPLFNQLNLEGILARIKPEEIRSAKKERKIDLEALDLKRKLYSKTTGPVVLSNREIRLLRHIDLNEEVRQKIQQCKKVAKKLERLDMKAAQLREQQEGLPPSLASDTSQLSSMNNNNNNNNNTDDGEQGSSMMMMSEEQRATFASKMDEFQATGVLSNLLDSSMFDELKDKMIESSSLLESLEDDDDEECHLSSGSQHSHNGSLNHDCCGCQCHRSSSIDAGADPKGAQKSPPTSLKEDQTGPPAADSTLPSSEPLKSTPKSENSPEDSAKLEPTREDSTGGGGATGEEEKAAPEVSNGTGEERDEDTESKSSLACDMAVQCDLLS